MTKLNFPDRSWRQRYWVSWDHYRQGGPVFILIGGEGAESPGWLQAGALHDFALQYSGAMFILGKYLSPLTSHHYKLCIESTGTTERASQ